MMSSGRCGAALVLGAAVPDGKNNLGLTWQDNKSGIRRAAKEVCTWWKKQVCERSIMYMISISLGTGEKLGGTAKEKRGRMRPEVIRRWMGTRKPAKGGRVLLLDASQGGAVLRA